MLNNLSKDELKSKLMQVSDLFPVIGEIADQKGYECYVVGGLVRDLILERPSHDIDVVVVGSGIQMASAFAEALPGKPEVAVFRNFGTARVESNGQEVEFVGARKESYDRGSRKPIVEEGTLRDDQLRRDFTINAMAICLNKDRFGELVDPFNGIKHLQLRSIQCPTNPDITFSDDPLRMLRAVRFASQLAFDVSPMTMKAIKKNLERLKIISKERIEVEFMKIMESPNPTYGLELLDESGLLEAIFPEVTALKLGNEKGHKDNFDHSLKVFYNVSQRTHNPWLRLAALLHDIGKGPTKAYEEGKGWTFHNHEYVGSKMIPDMFRRQKFPMDEHMKYVQKLIELHMRPQVIANEEVTDSAVRRLLADAGDDIDDLLLLCECDLTTKNMAKKERILRNYELVKEKIIDLKERDFKRLFQPCIDGNEIMEMFGIGSCREVGILKDYIKDEVLEGNVENTHEALEALLRKKAKEIGLLN